MRSRTVTRSPVVRPIRLGSTVVAAGSTTTTLSSEAASSMATIAVMSLVRLAGARGVSGSFSHSTTRESTSTRYADLPWIGSAGCLCSASQTMEKSKWSYVAALGAGALAEGWKTIDTTERWLSADAKPTNATVTTIAAMAKATAESRRRLRRPRMRGIPVRSTLAVTAEPPWGIWLRRFYPKGPETRECIHWRAGGREFQRECMHSRLRGLFRGGD